MIVEPAANWQCLWDDYHITEQTYNSRSRYSDCWNVDSSFHPEDRLHRVDGRLIKQSQHIGLGSGGDWHIHWHNGDTKLSCRDSCKQMLWRVTPFWWWTVIFCQHDVSTVSSSGVRKIPRQHTWRVYTSDVDVVLAKYSSSSTNRCHPYGWCTRQVTKWDSSISGVANVNCMA
jgi:hypothetical protein